MNGKKGESAWLREYLLSDRSCEELEAQRGLLLQDLGSYRDQLADPDIHRMAERIAEAEADIDGLAAALRERGC